MADKDHEDEDGKVRDNASPQLHPPGVPRPGMAPPGASGTAWVEGPFYLGGHGRNPFERGREVEAGAPELPKDKTTPRFRETGDAEVDAHYSKDHIMVASDRPDPPGSDDLKTPPHEKESGGFLMREDALENANDPALDDFHAQLGKDERAMSDEAELDEFHARDKAEESPGDDASFDRFHDRRQGPESESDGPPHERDRDDAYRPFSLSDEFNEKTRGRGR